MREGEKEQQTLRIHKWRVQFYFPLPLLVLKTFGNSYLVVCTLPHVSKSAWRSFEIVVVDLVRIFISAWKGLFCGNNKTEIKTDRKTSEEV